MLKIEVGQELEFILPATVDDRTIAKGTRVRVGQILTELTEPQVTLVVLGPGMPETITVARHVVALHCRPVK